MNKRACLILPLLIVGVIAAVFYGLGEVLDNVRWQKRLAKGARAR